MHRQVREEEEEEEEEYHRASAQQRRAISGYFSPSCASRRQQHTVKAAALHRVRLVNFCLLFYPQLKNIKQGARASMSCGPRAARILLKLLAASEAAAAAATAAAERRGTGRIPTDER